MKDWPYPRIIAHRGGGSLAPENTLAAIRLGQSLGYRCCEIDVKLSKDAVPFLLHDATLERTTSGRGVAAEFDWPSLVTLDAGGWHSDKFRGERLATLDDVAALLRERGTLINIEIKPSPGFERETGEKVALAAARLWSEAAVPPLFSSFSFEALMAAKGAAPQFPRGWLTKQVEPADWDRLDALEAAALHTDHRRLAREQVDRARARGLRVLVYTVNDPSAAETLMASGVDMIVTDNLAVFSERFRELI